MSSFAEDYGSLTVGQALELNKIAKEFCEMEFTVNSEDIEDIKDVF